MYINIYWGKQRGDNLYEGQTFKPEEWLSGRTVSVRMPRRHMSKALYMYNSKGHPTVFSITSVFKI